MQLGEDRKGHLPKRASVSQVRICLVAEAQGRFLFSFSLSLSTFILLISECFIAIIIFLAHLMLNGNKMLYRYTPWLKSPTK